MCMHVKIYIPPFESLETYGLVIKILHRQSTFLLVIYLKKSTLVQIWLSPVVHFVCGILFLLIMQNSIGTDMLCLIISSNSVYFMGWYFGLGADPEWDERGQSQNIKYIQ